MRSSPPSGGDLHAVAAGTFRFVQRVVGCLQQPGFVCPFDSGSHSETAGDRKAIHFFPDLLLQSEPHEFHQFVRPDLQFAVAVEAPAQGVPKPPAGGLEALVREPGQIETLIENLSQARENGRQARGEMQLRHEDFGVLTVKLANTEGELKASLSSRDPAFAVAAQHALGERVVQQTSDSSAASARNGDQPAGNAAHSGQRGTDPQAGGQDRAGSQTQRRDVETRSSSSAEDGGDLHAESHRAPRDRWLFA